MVKAEAANESREVVPDAAGSSEKRGFLDNWMNKHNLNTDSGESQPEAPSAPSEPPAAV